LLALSSFYKSKAYVPLYPRLEYHPRSRDALGQIEEAGLEISKLQAEPRGLLKINTPMSFGILHIAPALPAT
jgi:DNA-binding transcriptional LysR family regulator